MNTSLIRHDVNLPENYRWPTAIASVLLFVVIVLIVVLNSLGLVALHRFSTLPESTKMLMTSLTVADLLTGVFGAVPQLMETIYHKWVLGSFLCVAWGVVYPAFLTLSIFSLLLLTVDRFVAIVHPLRHQSIVTPHRTKITVGLLWVSGAVENIGLFAFGTPATATEETLYFCNYAFRDVYQAISIITIAFPLGAIVVLYLYILRVARRQARRIAAQIQPGFCSTITAGSSGAAPPRPVSTKSANTVIIITGALFLSWTPALILLSLYTQEIKFDESFNTLAKVALFSNSWVNVVIYYWRNKELRHAVNRLVLSLCRKP